MDRRYRRWNMARTIPISRRSGMVDSAGKQNKASPMGWWQMPPWVGGETEPALISGQEAQVLMFLPDSIRQGRVEWGRGGIAWRSFNVLVGVVGLVPAMPITCTRLRAGQTRGCGVRDATRFLGPPSHSVCLVWFRPGVRGGRWMDGCYIDQYVSQTGISHLSAGTRDMDVQQFCGYGWCWRCCLLLLSVVIAAEEPRMRIRYLCIALRCSRIAFLRL
ncbi:hypothetical protein B0T17DRAFT_503783 [Bombardia bombarda]|uniref:Uncharacterized protein n=1 Tax=Bombardia bombarda TaxID=252184 RepID=A0AA39XNL3_9PEZI|nr:hypothetical protein B0T17DRAFT_503783 [Bombardia bombarda]